MSTMTIHQAVFHVATASSPVSSWPGAHWELIVAILGIVLMFVTTVESSAGTLTNVAPGRTPRASVASPESFCSGPQCC